jgi:hypothetical protein
MAAHYCFRSATSADLPMLQRWRDPDFDNFRARNAFRNAGFGEVSGPVDTRCGRTILMERWSPGRSAEAG